MLQVFYIALGGILGTLQRYGLTLFSQRFGWEEKFPFATLGSNLLGCFLIGLCAAWFGVGERTTTYHVLYTALVTGYLGSLTTFSTFMLQSSFLLNSERFWLGLLNIFVSLVLGLLCVRFGSFVIHFFMQK